MRYLLAYYGPEGDEEVDPEEMRVSMERWSAFDAETVEKGAYVACEAIDDSSTATTLTVGEGDERIVTDGPFSEAKEMLGGFTLLECENLDEALAWAEKVPMAPGWKIEVRPVRDFTEYGYVDPLAAEAKAS